MISACESRFPVEASQCHQIIHHCELLHMRIELGSSKLLTSEPSPEPTEITSVAAMEKSGDSRGFLDQALI